jgi:hypothetical protein
MLKHGMSDTKIYRVWQDMIQRCHNPNDTGYHNWGGRGISVCDEWRKPEPFLEWAKDKWSEELEIDRIDNDGDYEPSNCRFISKSANNLNRRTRSDNTSGYQGVCWIEKRKKWRSRITINGKDKHLGFYDDLLDAVEARQNALNEHKAMIQATQEEA